MINKLFPILLSGIVAFYYSIIFLSRAYSGIINKKDKRFKDNIKVIYVGFFMRIVYGISAIVLWIFIIGALIGTLQR